MGLFGINHGMIQNATLENLRVHAENVDYVGGFCGINNGRLENDAVTGDSKIVGREYVGGIAGSDSSTSWWNTMWENLFGASKVKTYKNLRNEAEVLGTSYIGGVTGYVEGSQKTGFLEWKQLEIDKCTNVGYVHGTEKYIGGIIGYNVNAIISDCVGASQLTDEQYKEVVDDANKTGTYVGGIVGYQETGYGFIRNCMSGTQDARGYVVGEKEVGGIVGYSELSELKPNGSTNYAIVIGKENVGGIVGSNNATLRGWTNRGMAAASVENAGGITGLNEGTVVNCTTMVEATDAEVDSYLETLKTLAGTGKAIGGIVGSNQNTISYTEETHVKAVVYGKQYVGGVIGSSAIEKKNRKLTIQNIEFSGTVIAESTAGGIIGMLVANSNGNNDRGGVINCINHGWINAPMYAGGIVGVVDNTSANGKDSHITGCVNTGIIGTADQASNSGGIVGFADSANGGVEIDGCNNYGTSLCDDASFGGIIGEAGHGPGIYITNCFGVMNPVNHYPITKATDDTVENSYYFVPSKSLLGFSSWLDVDQGAGEALEVQQKSNLKYEAIGNGVKIDTLSMNPLDIIGELQTGIHNDRVAAYQTINHQLRVETFKSNNNGNGNNGNNGNGNGNGTSNGSGGSDTPAEDIEEPVTPIEPEQPSVTELPFVELREMQTMEKSVEQTQEQSIEWNISYDTLMWGYSETTQIYQLHAKTSDLDGDGYAEEFTWKVTPNADKTVAPLVEMQIPGGTEETPLWATLGAEKVHSTDEENAANGYSTITYRYPLWTILPDEQEFGYKREITISETIINEPVVNEETAELVTTETTVEHRIPLCAYLEYVETTVTATGEKTYEYRLVLPDVTSEEGVAVTKSLPYYFTAEVSIVANPVAEDTTHIASKINRWYRTVDEYGNPVTKIEELQQEQ